MPMPEYFEDFEVGATQKFGEYRVTREEILEFAARYDPQPFHLSDEAAAKTLFGSLCASGWHTCAMLMSMIVENMQSGNPGGSPRGNPAALGSPGIDEIRWTKPVYPGDTLRVESTILDKKPSRSRPEIGTIYMQNKVYNQNDELVMSNKPMVMYRRRNPVGQ